MRQTSLCGRILEKYLEKKKTTFNITGQDFCCVSKNIFRAREVRVEAAGHHLGTVFEIQ
jgi:hypothetical protein